MWECALFYGASQVAPGQRTRLPMQETWVRSLVQEDPLEAGMAFFSLEFSSLRRLLLLHT